MHKPVSNAYPLSNPAPRCGRCGVVAGLSYVTNKRRRGFTLIELMNTVVVISVLALIAVPSYQQYVRQARRVQAQAELINLQRAIEKYRINNPSYEDCVADGACSLPSSDYYTYSVSAASATGYSLSAEAKGAQAADSGCSPLTLNQNSVKGPSGCWKD